MHPGVVDEMLDYKIGFGAPFATTWVPGTSLRSLTCLLLLLNFPWTKASPLNHRPSATNYSLSTKYQVPSLVFFCAQILALTNWIIGYLDGSDKLIQLGWFGSLQRCFTDYLDLAKSYLSRRRLGCHFYSASLIATNDYYLHHHGAVIY